MKDVRQFLCSESISKLQYFHERSLVAIIRQYFLSLTLKKNSKIKKKKKDDTCANERLLCETSAIIFNKAAIEIVNKKHGTTLKIIPFDQKASWEKKIPHFNK